MKKLMPKKPIGSRTTEPEYLYDLLGPSESSSISPKASRTNWSLTEDRGEDLINQRDFFIQKPERDSEMSPELEALRVY